MPTDSEQQRMHTMPNGRRPIITQAFSHQKQTTCKISNQEFHKYKFNLHIP